MDRRTFLGSAGTAVTATLAGCFQDVESGDNATPTAGNDATATATGSGGDDLEVEFQDAELVRENEGTADETVAVVGTAVNKSGSEYSYFEVVATFLDGNGESLGTASASKTYFYNDSSWEFEIEYDETGETARAVNDYELSGQT